VLAPYKEKPSKIYDPKTAVIINIDTDNRSEEGFVFEAPFLDGQNRLSSVRYFAAEQYTCTRCMIEPLTPVRPAPGFEAVKPLTPDTGVDSIGPADCFKKFKIVCNL